MAKKHIEKIKETTTRFLEKAGIKHDVSVKGEEDIIEINIVSEDSALLIGYRGETLAALEHILKLMIQNELSPIDEFPKIIVDVGGYREEQSQKLKEFAHYSAQKVIQSKMPEVLRPMNAYERRQVHLALKDFQELVTESVGVDPERRIIIKVK